MHLTTFFCYLGEESVLHVFSDEMKNRNREFSVPVKYIFDQYI